VRIVDRSKTSFDCELVSLHVRPGGYRQGTGRALVAGAARRMHALNCRSLGLWVLDGNPARHFYERLGGVQRGEQFFELDETTLRREIGFVWDEITTLFAA
jgi:GNAT superfamily N-acetyltransferase